MLQKDIRRRQRYIAATRVIRREWLEKNEKWSSCPNTSLTVSLEDNADWIGENDLFFFPDVAFPEGGHMNILVCFGCLSMWSVATTYGSHP